MNLFPKKVSFRVSDYFIMMSQLCHSCSGWAEQIMNWKGQGYSKHAQLFMQVPGLGKAVWSVAWMKQRLLSSLMWRWAYDLFRRRRRGSDEFVWLYTPIWL